MYWVTKEFSFDSAHRLVNGYVGKCSNIHGHTWKVRFTAQSHDLNPFGFVRDFGDFKPMKQFIDDQLDHAMLVSQHDDVMIQFCVEQKQKFYVMGDNPTSERLARELYELGLESVPDLVAVEIDETCTCSARYTP